MAEAPKCPYCKGSTSYYIVRDVTLASEANFAETQGFRIAGLEISCPSCQTILSVIVAPEYISESTAKLINEETVSANL